MMEVFLIVKKRQILTATLIIALGAAVAVNWYYTNPEKQNNTSTTTVTESVSGNLGDSMLVAGTVPNEHTSTEETTDYSSAEYFAQAKLSRENSNDKITDQIDEILENEVLSEADKNKIEKLVEEYQNTVKSQTDAENLIKAKTGSECLVVINDGACQVIMEKNSLNEAVILQITEIIEKNTNISAENLTIIESK